MHFERRTTQSSAAKVLKLVPVAESPILIGRAPKILFQLGDKEELATALARVWAKERSSLYC